MGHMGAEVGIEADAEKFVHWICGHRRTCKNCLQDCTESNLTEPWGVVGVVLSLKLGAESSVLG